MLKIIFISINWITYANYANYVYTRKQNNYIVNKIEEKILKYTKIGSQMCISLDWKKDISICQ